MGKSLSPTGGCAGKNETGCRRPAREQRQEQLVLIRADQNGMIMYTAYYADEVRDFGEIPKGNGKLGKQELELGEGLIQQLSTEDFRPDKSKDEYRLRVLTVPEKKAKTGEEILRRRTRPTRPVWSSI